MTIEEKCKGNFLDLRKSLFLLTGAEAPLLAKVQNYNRIHLGSVMLLF